MQSAESGITPNYDRLVLCRVENADDNSLDYLEFSCDTSAESLQNALVVVEEFDDGDLDLKLLQDQDFDIKVIE